MPSNAKLLAGAAGGGDLADPNFKNVTLLLHGDGSNGAQNNTFIDSSTNNFTITRNGNTTQGSFSPYGSNWSNYFDGSADYLTVPDNAAFSYGTGDFTIECWVYASGLGSTRRLYYHVTTSPTQVTIYQLNTNYIGFYASNGGTVIVDILSNTLLPANAWTHIAIVRNGTSFTLYQNGVSVATATSSSSMPDPTGVVNIGALDTGNEAWLGYISNFRIVKGTAVYTSAFTPPTAPLTAITNTSLLTCAYNRFRDGSTNNFTITRNGDVKVTNFAPFAPSSAYSTSTNGGSAYFDGTDDYLTLPDNDALEMGSSNFTLEMWINTLSSTQYATLYSRTISNFVTGDWSLMINHSSTTGGELAFYAADYNVSLPLLLTTGVSIRDAAWHHIAVVRNGSSWVLYVDGISRATATWSGTIANTSGGPSIGRDQSFTRTYAGYISNLRFVKGTAVYTAAFTPPSSPVTAITNTSLLLNATNAAIFDNSMKNDLETVGNAQISTSVKKFGTGSMAFDGNGDYLRGATNEVFAMRTGDFTVEAWVYFTDTAATNRAFFDTGVSSNTGRLLIRQGNDLGGSANVVDAYLSGTTATSPTFSFNQWVHVAVVRSSGTLKVYINGTGGTGVSATGDLTQTNCLIGAFYDQLSWNFTGYIDDLRVTRGVARYTANFTPPTAAFPNK